MRPGRRASHRSGRGSRLAPARRPAPAYAPDRRLPTSVATALQEMGILQSEGVPAHWRLRTDDGVLPRRSVWREVEEWPRPVLLLCSLTCFMLLFGLIAWHPWR